MKQNILIATLLAAMLALAGCGGGSSSGPEKSDSMKGAGNTEPKPLPDTGLTNTGDEPRVIRVVKDTPFDTGTGKITCPVAECVITVSAQEGTPVVTQTGGAKFAKTEPPGLGEDQPTDSTNPLSHDVLFKVVSGAETLWRLGGTALTAEPNPSLMIKDGSETTELRLRSIGGATTLKKDGEYIYWGSWSKKTEETGSKKTTYGDYGVVMGGGKPYGKKPESSIYNHKTDGAGHKKATTATYTDMDAIVNYRKKSTDKWTPIAQDAMAKLTADFSKGMIGGNIVLGANKFSAPTVMMPPETIRFRDTSIGSDGTFSGNVEDSVSTGETGSWKGQFFGDTTGFGGTPRKSVAIVPSHATAGFSMSRPETKDSNGTIKQDALHIGGAFGAQVDRLVE